MKKTQTSLISIILPIIKNSKLTPFLSQSHSDTVWLRERSSLKNVACAFSPITHFHQLKAFSTKKQKHVFRFKWQATLPRYKLRKESASSVQVGCIVWKEANREGGASERGTGEETLAQNWQFSVRFSRQQCRLRRPTTTQPARLDCIRSPASASRGKSQSHCAACWEHYLHYTHDTEQHVWLWYSLCKNDASSP